MPKRDQLLSDLQGDDALGVLLMGQMGGVPNELQFMIQTVSHDEAAGGLRDRNRYIIRALGVVEHQFSLGLFKTLRFTREHPLLLPHTTPSTGLFFRGGPPPASSIPEIMLDITQAHAGTFAGWRDLAADLNHDRPLAELLRSGGGLLGEMPRPAAERIARVLERHGLETRLIADPAFKAQDDHGRSTAPELLLIDEGYVVSLAFSVDQMGQV